MKRSQYYEMAVLDQSDERVSLNVIITIVIIKNIYSIGLHHISVQD